MKKAARFLPLLLVTLFIADTALADPVTVTGYHSFQASSDSSENEEEAFNMAMQKAYTQCHARGQTPRRATDWELMFPSWTGVGDSDCIVSDPMYGPYRYFECRGWYKATCIDPPSEAQHEESDAGSSHAGNDGAGGAPNDGNNGAEGAAPY